MKDGWIKLYRILKDNEIWKNKEPYDKRSAWIDLLLRSTHQKIKFLFGNEIIELIPGQIITSELKLATEWKWSRHKVRDFLKTLERIGQIGTPKRTSKYTIITIINWELYQEREEGKDTKEDNEGTSKGHQKDTYKNVKKDKKVKKGDTLSSKVASIIGYLNEKTGRNEEGQRPFDPRKAVSLLRARFNEGRTVKDCIDVVDIKSKDWLDDEKMFEYLRPSTLFRKTNFENYITKKRPDKYDKYLKKE